MIFCDTIIPTHTIGTWLLNFIDNLLDSIGLRGHQTLETAIYIAIIACIAIFVGYLLRRFILAVVEKLASLRKTQMMTDLINEKVFTKCSHIIPPLVMLAMVPLAFSTDPKTIGLIERCVVVYLFIALAVAINGIISYIYVNYNRRKNAEGHPLKGLLITAHGIVWGVIVIISISVLIDKSPATLLAGLGAFAAALMLIFKDSILGFVSGIQLSQNDMLRVGDWIVVQGTDANGVVEDVSLTVVKVRNWDNTLVMVPPYTLVSTSFQNWRGMSETGRRQIVRDIYFDNTSIGGISDESIDAIVAACPIIKDYVAKMRELPAGEAGLQYNSGLAVVNGTIATNMGLFRAYLCQWLLNNDKIAQDSQILVRLRPSEAWGTTLQIYCYTNTTDWTIYEAVQSAIMEHVAAMAPTFGLKIYAAPDHDAAVPAPGTVPQK
ncbi:MAG: mechanosensitive ion channel family protein [Muribaculaceae bacterium]|nr:mechanosensitive ion channel family protein [Muribaculaceae bacterium]